MSAIAFDKVSFHYTADRPVIRDISFDVAEGESVLLLGRNGAGKSSTLKLLNGICTPTAGVVRINGRSTGETLTSQLAHEIAVTFQHPANQIFAGSVRAEIAFGPTNLRRPNAETLVQAAADTCGLSTALNKHPYDLSYAGRKLVTIASAIAMETSILAFDEPSAGLSGPEIKTLLSVFESLRRRGKTTLVITHDPDLFLPFATRVIVLQGGMVRFDGTSTLFLAQQRSLRRYGADLPLRMRLERLVKDYSG